MGSRLKLLACRAIEAGVQQQRASTHGGTFDAAYSEGEQPQHAVRISQGFWIGKYEVTQAQWEHVMESNPSKFPEARCPVDSVSWQDCQTFVERLSDQTGQPCRMPTEAEWEYACRAGTTTEFSFGKDPDDLGRHAWYVENRDYKAHPVGDKLPNALGIFDMHGNVSEWCHDWLGDYSADPTTDPQGPQDGQYRVQRGGSWSDVPAQCRSASREGGIPNQGSVATGFRVVRDREGRGSQ